MDTKTFSNESQTPFFGPGNVEPAGKPKRGLAVVAVILGLLLLLLVYLYWLMSKPPTAAEAPKTPGLTNVFSIYGWGKNRLRHPESVALDASGNIYVADTGNHRMVAFNNAGAFRFVSGQRTVKVGVRPKQLLLPLGVTVDPNNGDIFVTMFDFGKVMVFDRNGKYKREFVHDKPVRIKYHKGKLYITNPGGMRVTDLRGKVLKSFGSKGRNIGQFEMPTGIDFDSKDNMFISDTQNMRIQILDKRGKIAGGIGRPPEGMNDSERLFGLPAGLALDENENVFVVDAFHHAVRVFDHNGKDYGEFGKEGNVDGTFSYPSDVVYAGDNVFVVADKWNNRIQVVRINATDKGLKQSQGKGIGAIGWQIPALILALILMLAAWYWNRQRNAQLN